MTDNVSIRELNQTQQLAAVLQAMKNLVEAIDSTEAILELNLHDAAILQGRYRTCKEILIDYQEGSQMNDKILTIYQTDDGTVYGRVENPTLLENQRVRRWLTIKLQRLEDVISNGKYDQYATTEGINLSVLPTT